MPKKPAIPHTNRPFNVQADAQGSVRVADAAKLLGVAPQTIRNWIASGCPCTDPGGQGAGAVTLVHMADVMEWQVERSMRDAGGSDDGAQYNEGRAKAKDMHYRAIIRQAQALEKMRLSVPVDVIGPIVDAEYSAVRNALLGIPSSLDIRVAAEADPRKCYEMIEAEVVRALSSLSSGRQVAAEAGLDPDGSIHHLDAIAAMEEAADASEEEEAEEDV